MAITGSLTKKATESNNLVSVLPPEVIEWEILPRLSVKSLLQYKSVCKSWNLLISTDHNFVKSQLHHNLSRDSLILHQVSFYNSFVVGCIDGLVCVFRWVKDASKVDIAIWNPATNLCLAIPPLPKRSVRRYDVLLGFGYDSVENDFKVIYGSLIEEKPLACDVYSCKAACWKKIAPSNILYRGKISQKWKPIIFNGSPFWLIRKRQDAEISLVVISFDVRLEVFRLLPSFSCVATKNFRKFVFTDFMDSLAIMVYDVGRYSVEPIDVYIFNQISSVWNKKISIGPIICKEPDIKLKEIAIGTFIRIPETIMLHSIIPCSRNGDILFLNARSCRLYGVNPKTHTIKLLKDGSFPERIYNCFNYSESLSFVKGMKPLSDKRYEGSFIFLHRDTLELAPSYQYI
ncbi:F-box/kelch-repeat protein At3g23880-like [Daucus carota subsp. sativus]|uniref:F-box/kelch-repeat protein At3g23880-like n=1 Tax=Daucus carota subsp. sativus TaxID=79200 RepID=UPI0007EF05F0|nr:PREDICTED: F-box/kelch-repeat protein At3g23880-like [Daucus carota subsp. sativus]